MELTQHPLYSAFYGLVQTPRADGLAPIITLTSPFSQVGTSYVARSLALLASEYYRSHGLRVALIDYDLNQQSQAAYFEDGNAQTRHGAFMGPFDLTFGEKPFWQVSPGIVDDNGQRLGAGSYGGSFLIGDSGLVISKFDWKAVRTGQQVHVRDVPKYWNRMRQEFALIIADTPAFDRGDTSVNMISISDKTVIVCDPVRTHDTAISELCANIGVMGGHYAGVIVNAGRAEPMQSSQAFQA